MKKALFKLDQKNLSNTTGGNPPDTFGSQIFTSFVLPQGGIFTQDEDLRLAQNRSIYKAVMGPSVQENKKNTAQQKDSNFSNFLPFSIWYAWHKYE